MQHSRHLIFFSLLLIAALTAAGCSPTAVAVQPTPEPQAIEGTVQAVKTQAAETVIAELTANAPIPTETLLPSPTPIPPTEEPTPMPVLPSATSAPVFPTATFIPLPTQTSTPSAYSCTVVSQSPGNDSTFKIREDFDLVVKIKNTGTQDWDKHVVDFYYASGTKFQSYVDIIDLPEHVQSGNELILVIDMTAPDKAGTYTASWVVGAGSSTKFCTVSINIKVTE
jgi:hypothetical protein